MNKKNYLSLLLAAVLLITPTPIFAYDGALNGWAYEAVGFTTPSPVAVETETPAEVRIALIDTGVSTKRIDPDLLEPGKNYVFEDAGTEDLTGHGTRVASLILGAANETGNLPALAASAKLVPLVYYSKYPSGVPANGGIEAICRAIYDAVDLYGCKVINISSGVIIPDDRLAEAVLYAEANNVIVVSAVGNDHLRAPERQYYPAAYDTVVGVGAVNEKLELSAFSQRSNATACAPGEYINAVSAFSQRNSVTVCAPGEFITVVSIKNSRFFEAVSGTSYATAFVSALAASLLGKYPDMTPEEFREVLKISSRDDKPEAMPPDYNDSDKSAAYNDSGVYALINYKNAFDCYEELISIKKETENNG